MAIFLGILGILAILGGGLGFMAASTVFQEIVSGMVVMTGFICLVGSSLLEAVLKLGKRWDAAQERAILQNESVQKTDGEMMIAVNRLRQEQEQTNRLLIWLGEIQQGIKPDSTPSE